MSKRGIEGSPWYFLHDPTSGRAHRFNSIGYQVVGRMTGELTINDIWEQLTDKLGDDAPTQDEILRLFIELHAADLLLCDKMPDLEELQKRYRKHKRRELLSRFLNPMAVRFALIDPESFLRRFIPLIGPVFSPIGFCVWLVVVGGALIMVGEHWAELTENISDRVLAPSNLLIMLVVFPIIKSLHEFGHAFAVKRWGGEVHEMGVMFLVLMPIPYVDATAAWSFKKKSQRMIVGAAGMFVEVFVACLCLMLWLQLDVGTARSILFNIIVIAGISTVLFNANPLLRFDGYYILQDFLDIPNLGTRANRYIGYLCQRYLFKVKDADPIATSVRERVWFVCYGAASFVYRMMIATIIVVFIAGKYFLIGAILAVWAMVIMFVVPLAKIVRFVLFDPKLAKTRLRAMGVSVSIILLVSVLMFVLQVPHSTVTEGVVWAPEEAQVRAATDGTVRKVMHRNAEHVSKGEPLFECEDYLLEAKVRKLIAELEELRVKYRSTFKNDIVSNELVRKEIDAVVEELQREQEKFAHLVIRSPRDGVLIIPRENDMPGRFLRKGQLIGYVLNESSTTIRTVLPQAGIDEVKNRTQEVRILSNTHFSGEQLAKIRRYVPAATDKIPSVALTREGGGDIPNSPTERDRRVAFNNYFLIELEVPGIAPEVFGDRVFIKFVHERITMFEKIYRRTKPYLVNLFHV